MKGIAYFFLTLCIANTIFVVADESEVNTSYGVVKGKVLDTHREFRGIPYAAPPINDLRWSDTQPPKAWTGVYEATKDGPGCPQKCYLPAHTCPPVTSEDCLYLNVFTPRKAHLKDPVPVLFFIHGGNFKQGYGGGFLYNGEKFANDTGVILVAINYRLGALGTLYLGEGGLTGNYNIMDQRMALQFVQDNIAAFGGDPSRVTVFGQSAGAMSIAAHMSSKDGGSKGLFRSAIMESEPFALRFRTTDDFKNFGTSAFAKKANCTDSNSRVKCLKSLTADQIIEAQVAAEHDLLADLFHILEVFLPWTPTIRTNMLPRAPVEVFSKGDAMAVPFMIGTVRNEAREFIYMGFGKPLPEVEYDIVLDVVFGFGNGDRINKYYPLPPGEKNDTRNQASKVGTDGLFICPTRNATIGQRSANVPAFVYHFDHVWSFGKSGWGPEYSFCWNYVCHGAELPFVFAPNATEMGMKFTQDEVALAKTMRYYWANFARTGNPGKGDKEQPLLWPEYDASSQSTMTFQTPKNIIRSKVFNTQCDFWDTIGYQNP